MPSRLFSAVLAVLVAFVSYQLYNPPTTTTINMAGDEMKTFEDPKVLGYVQKIQ
jgi:hypothetical protein